MITRNVKNRWHEPAWAAAPLAPISQECRCGRLGELSNAERRPTLQPIAGPALVGSELVPCCAPERYFVDLGTISICKAGSAAAMYLGFNPNSARTILHPCAKADAL